MPKIAHEIARRCRTPSGQDLVAAAGAAKGCAVSDEWQPFGAGYRKYTFVDGSFLSISPLDMRPVDVTDASSIRDYVSWLDAETRAATAEEIVRLFTALGTDGADPDG